MNSPRTVTTLCGIILILLSSCNKKPSTIQISSLFTLMPDDYTHLEFENRLVDEMGFNVFKYRNYYNGGGVAIGDVNSDGLPDVYLSSNQQSNKLFINKGNFQFKDVTKQTQVGGTRKWATGVCMADINGDRLLDIYVCNSGNIKGDDRANELFINQGIGSHGIPIFREAAAEYGLDNRGFSTHAAFFDYDRDGDLDMYLLNNAFRPISTFDLSFNLREESDPLGGDYLYRNEDGIFVAVTETAGIYNSVIGFGLGLTVSDINNDGWLDIYVANDFFERDYLYINNHDGTFTENLEEMLQHTSLSSMGSDIADLNNDGLVDIFTSDMLPEDDYRLKTTFTFDPFDFNRKHTEWGYYHQLSQNALQLNRGVDADGRMLFSDIGLMAGVAMTDWSWGTFIVDLNNDGWKDILVSNGIFRDVTDQDNLDYLSRRENVERILQGDRIDFPELIRNIPSTKLSNHAFANNGDLTFSNRAQEWGLDIPSFSNGVAYGDLDGDGDNDLVINNVNQSAFLFRNESDSLTANHYLKVKLMGEGMNSLAIGSKVTLHCAEETFVLEQMPMRGFHSSMDYVLTLGLGKHTRVDTLKVDWPDGSRTTATDVTANQMITLYQKEASPSAPKLLRDREPLLHDITETFPLRFRHVENHFIDFQREPLIPHLLSTEGPKIAKGDINGDGRDDLYLGGAKGTAGRILVQTASGTFESTNEGLLRKSNISEDVDAAFFDADGDGDQDLYVVSGGNEYSRQAPALLDRFYINDGSGEFSLSNNRLPKFYASGSCVASGDFDSDGDTDLFVGSRSVPWKYGLTPTSYLLENDGQGLFSVVTEAYAHGLDKVGMVTDAAWIDYDNDGDLDLVVVGEWMPVTLYENTGRALIEITSNTGLEKTSGWWNCIVTDDLNGDGIIDLVAGNLGNNSKIKASLLEPAAVYISDFDNNGLIEQILCTYKSGKSYPMLLRPDLVNQLPYLKEKFPTHADYGGKEITDVFSEEQLNRATVRKAYTFATTLFYGNGDGTFQQHLLPVETQFSPIYAIIARDFDGDGSKDLLLAGNFHGVPPQLGRYDASYGTLLLGGDNTTFKALLPGESGLLISGQVRDIATLTYQDGREVILIAKNDAPIQVYRQAPK